MRKWPETEISSIESCDFLTLFLCYDRSVGGATHTLHSSSLLRKGRKCGRCRPAHAAVACGGCHRTEMLGGFESQQRPFRSKVHGAPASPAGQNGANPRLEVQQPILNTALLICFSSPHYVNLTPLTGGKTRPAPRLKISGEAGSSVTPGCRGIRLDSSSYRWGQINQKISLTAFKLCAPP